MWCGIIESTIEAWIDPIVPINAKPQDVRFHRRLLITHIAASPYRSPDSIRYGSNSREAHAISGREQTQTSAFERCASMATEEVHMTDPGEMKLPVVRPGPSDDGAAGLIEHAVLEVCAR